MPEALSKMYEENMEYADAFSEDVIKRDSWYMRMLSRVRKTPKKYPKWKIEEGSVYKYHYHALLDPVLSKVENWKLVVPEELRHREDFRPSSARKLLTRIFLRRKDVH